MIATNEMTVIPTIRRLVTQGHGSDLAGTATDRADSDPACDHGQITWQTRAAGEGPQDRGVVADDLNQDFGHEVVPIRGGQLLLPLAAGSVDDVHEQPGKTADEFIPTARRRSETGP
jgi:hypothetical protein